MLSTVLNYLATPPRPALRELSEKRGKAVNNCGIYQQFPAEIAHHPDSTGGKRPSCFRLKGGLSVGQFVTIQALTKR